MNMPPQIDNARDLLLEQLGVLLTMEGTLVNRVLPQLTRELQDEELRKAVTEHLEQSRGHVGNVQRAFLELGAVPAGRPAPGLDGLVAERQAQIGELVPALRAGFDCAAAMGTEHYEINAYEAAIRLADSLGETEVGSLLRMNLDQEVAALGKLGEQADRLAQAAVAQPVASA
jgi:ferritin-like metal-binding protein YciE